MSGLEVVGVVLGVIPLLVEGLKAVRPRTCTCTSANVQQYQDGLRTASHMVKYEKAVETLVLRFSVNASLYLHTCERLIRPLMLEADEWSELADNPGGPAWKSEELGQQIIGRLGTDYTTYINVAKRLHARLIKFAVNLDLDVAAGLKVWIAALTRSR